MYHLLNVPSVFDLTALQARRIEAMGTSRVCGDAEPAGSDDRLNELSDLQAWAIKASHVKNWRTEVFIWQSLGAFYSSIRRAQVCRQLSMLTVQTDTAWGYPKAFSETQREMRLV